MRRRDRPLRILMTADAVGGVWQYSMTLAEALGAERAELRLAVMGPPPSAAQRAQAERLANLRLAHGDFRLEWMPDAERDLARAGDWLLDMAAEMRPDIVHLNGYAHAALPWPAPVLVVAHSCVLSWWQAVHGMPAPAAWHGYAQRVSLGLAQADSVVSPTRAMRDALATHYGSERGGHVIANGCFLERLAPAPKEEFILAAGRLWDEGKNLAALDAAAARLPWPVYVAGDPRHPDGRVASPRAARTLGVLAPAALADRMARAAIYALPARYEPFGLSVLEAAASGCALVLGCIPSLRELWEGAALFVDPDDHDALAQAIAGLIAEPERRAALASAARRRSRDFSAAAMAQGYIELYREHTPGRAAAPTLAGAV